jgi:acetoin utilization protein AcuB
VTAPATHPRKLHQFPLVRSYMNPSPQTVNRAESLSVAERVMREHRIHHLPVLDGEQVTGLLSQRDALLAESLPGVNPLEVRVEEVMAEQVFTASPDAPLAEVVSEMMKRKIGSAVIVEEGRCVGVFTTTDALTALAELLSEPI